VSEALQGRRARQKPVEAARERAYDPRNGFMKMDTLAGQACAHARQTWFKS
jgi:hypothetical protein